MKPYFEDDAVTLYHGDCVEVMGAMAPESVHAVVTDPPYGLAFMGQGWDATGVAFRPVTWAAARRVLKPGGHLLAFGGTRTSHRMVCAVEDAGFEVRDTLVWMYGSGFPKSLDVSKAIDKAAGAEREVVGAAPHAANRRASSWQAEQGRPHGMVGRAEGRRLETAPATDAARQWAGWGTALKPAYEPIVLARKPLAAGSVAANVLAHGTGALNVDGCRIDGTLQSSKATGTTDVGRWPANVVLDEATAAAMGPPGRYFYTAKASPAERQGVTHPTVKPVALMRWLCRLVTPSGGVVLDCFAGSGTTRLAALAEGLRVVLIEQNAEYLDQLCGRAAQTALPLDAHAP